MSKSTDYAELAVQGPTLQAAVYMAHKINEILLFSKATTIMDPGAGAGPASQAINQLYGLSILLHAKVLATYLSSCVLSQIQGMEKINMDVQNAQDLSGIA